MPITAGIVVPHPPLIFPEVGRGQEAGIADTVRAYREAMQLLAGTRPETRPEVVVLISPHATSYADYFHISPGAHAQGEFSSFGAGQVRLQAEYHQPLAAGIATAAQRHRLPAGGQGERDTKLDHGSMIPLRFLQEVLAVPIVRIGLSGLSLREHYRLGECIAEAAGTLRVAVIASGDLSHKLLADGPYGYAPEGPELDALITGALETGDFGALLEVGEGLRERGAECGLGAICIMAGALDGRGVRSRLLSYEGPFGVGYAVATFLPQEADDTRHFGAAYEQAQLQALQLRRAGEDAYVRLARQAVEAYVQQGQAIAPPGDLPQELLQTRAGVFVSLHKHGALRGCIGTIAPTTGSIAEEIIQNGISAATEDHRFESVRPEELPSLAVKVDVLQPPERIDSMAELDPKEYGVIVYCGSRRGLLLPDLEGVDTPEQQVEIARQKAGIRPQEDVRLERFRVVRHGQ